MMVSVLYFHLLFFVNYEKLFMGEFTNRKVILPIILLILVIGTSFAISQITLK